MGFCTVINCIDGRAQLPVIRYLQQRFDVEHVDSVTEPGPNLILCEQTRPTTVQSILERVNISIEQHSSVGVAIAGHHGCAGNPASREDQLEHLQRSIEFLTAKLDGMEIVGLWVDEEWQVHEVPSP